MTASRVSAEARCPACQKRLDGATDPSGTKTPKPGDLSVCMYCALMLRFNTDLSVRALLTEEFAKLSYADKEELQALQHVVRSIRA